MNTILLKLSGLLLCFCLFTNVSAANSLSKVAPRVIKNPGLKKEYAPQIRQFTGIPSLAVTAKGRLWATWYSGITPNEDQNNYVVVATSTDKGKTWKEILVIDPDGKGPGKAFDPQAWIAPDGKLWISWTQRSVHEDESMLWVITTTQVNSNNPEWTSPKMITPGIMMNKPLILSSGEWILPASTYRTDNSVKVVISYDHGNTWNVKSTIHVPAQFRTPDEPMIVERKNGSLWMLVRTKYGIGESISTDKGLTWSLLKQSSIEHTPSRFFLRRLKSGNLLLVKHGPIHVRTGRSHLMAFISKDDGRSWSKGLLIDERNTVSYPDGQQAPDGTIYIIYDYDRRGSQTILMTQFTEDDILSTNYDEKIISVYNQRKLVSRGGANSK